jgi:hypothetical protein
MRLGIAEVVGERAAEGVGDCNGDTAGDWPGEASSPVGVTVYTPS